MSDERLRHELANLFRFGAKKPGKPKVTLTAEEFEAVLERLRALRDELQENNERLVRILGDKE